ncbi:MAG TPA: YraN family protein [Mycobacterium sp.]|nr:YraN family protein [Mycobacterium sp.]
MTSLTPAQLGALGEQLAVDHLRGLGLQLLARNWRCPHGELDLIAADPATGTLVFVEVKTRTTDAFGGPAQAVTPQKVRRLRRLAGLWLAAQRAGPRNRWSAIRIDVIGVRIAAGPPDISHLQGVG